MEPEPELEMGMPEGKITASAPCKLILCGEHFVVYGAPAISMPIELRNTVELTWVEDSNSVIVEGILGTFDFSMPQDDLPPEAALYYAAYKTACKMIGRRPEGLRFHVSKHIHPKGLGNSSSVAAAIAAACFAAANVRFSPQKLFECAQAADLAATDGRASGIDARTVTATKAQIFTRSFNPDKYSFQPLKISLPEDSCLLLIDTYKDERSTTGEQVEKFAQSWGVQGVPSELSSAQRDKICAPYMEIFNQMREELAKTRPSGEKIGKLFLENHLLLAKRGVSTDDMDRVVKSCVKSGAWGAKMTAAGGNGGAVVAICPQNAKESVSEAAAKLGFACIEAPMAAKGVRVFGKL